MNTAIQYVGIDVHQSTLVIAVLDARGKTSGPLKTFFEAMLARGFDREMATLTLARKIAAYTLRLWKKGETFDPAKLTMSTS